MLHPNPPGAELENLISDVGNDLARTLTAVLHHIPGVPHRPTTLARQLALDKVLTSRLLKALRRRDPLSFITLTPGPGPLRRLLHAARSLGVDPAAISDAETAVAQFEHLIRREAGGRRALDSMISAWLPDARHDFELRAKKAAFNAMSHLKGVCADTHLLTFLLYPSDDGRHADFVWLFGLLGLRRLRAGPPVHFTSSRISMQEASRRDVRALDGQPLEHPAHGLLPQFCSTPMPRLDVQSAGDTVHYTLAEAGFGPDAAVDLVCANLNRRARTLRDRPGHGRRTSYYAQIRTPVTLLQFDMLLHEDVYPGVPPELVLYDTSVEGTADVNDPGRDPDRYRLAERIDPLGMGVSSCRSGDVPAYADLLREVCRLTGWDGHRLRAYRCRVEYPVYGCQVAMTFQVPEASC